MKRTLYVVLPLTATILVIAWMTLSGPVLNDQPQNLADQSAPDDARTASDSHPTMHESAAEELSDEQLTMLADPRVLRFSKRLEIEEEIQDFFETHQSLSADEREQRAETIREQLDMLSNERQISQQEKLLVEIALLQATLDDEEEQREAAHDLIERYQDASQQRMDQWAGDPSPEFESYKEAEARIVQEAMARDDLSDDAERQRYLERRLREARLEAYGREDSGQ